MTSVRHIEQQLKELRIQYDQFSEILAKLNEKYVYETDVLEKFKLENHIREQTAKREATYQKMEILERSEISTKLYQALLRLNYIEQTKVFKCLTDLSPVGAFIIHGDPYYGQRWLLNRLLKQVFHTPGEIPLTITFSPRRRWDFQVVLREIGQQTGIRNPLSLTEIVEQLYRRWQQGTVVLIFHQVGKIHRELLQELWEKFWCELAKKTTNPQSRQYKLLLFLVDDDGSVNTWPFTCSENVNTSWEPLTPIQFPRLTLIRSEELKNWIDHEWDALPESIRTTPIEDILQQSDAGIPQSVLEHLCTLWGCDWLEMEPQWLIH